MVLVQQAEPMQAQQRPQRRAVVRMPVQHKRVEGQAG